MGMVMRLGRLVMRAGIVAFFCIACAVEVAPALGVQARGATPTASDPGCEQLPAYFAAVNGLVAGNDGLTILKTVDNDVLSLTSEQAKHVSTSLDALLVAWDGITPPPAAEAWHAAQRDLFAWYRDMAVDRDHLDHQRLINRDKTIVPALGRATLLGQQACGVEVWKGAIITPPAMATPGP